MSLTTATAPGTELAVVKAAPEHVTELGRILFEAFGQFHKARGLPLEYPEENVARRTIFMLVHRKDFYGAVAVLDGRPVGSGFLLEIDEVGGIGPVTVEPAAQGRGIARRLTEHLIEHAEKRGMRKLRLMQEACNAQSLALYASLGFEAKEEVAYMQARPSDYPDPTVRAMTSDDMAAIDELSTGLYGVSRRNEAAAAVRYGSSALLRQQDGKISGYLIAGINGHGVAETEDDALALVGEVGKRQPHAGARFFCPLGEGALLRRALRMGCRIIRVWTLMARGPYDPPRGAWMPSSTY